MTHRIARLLTLAALLYLAILLLLAAPSFFDPEFELVNNTTAAVSVVASWRGGQRTFERVLPNNPHRFSVRDEGAMRFRVRYADGRELESEPVYFTSGITLIVIITEQRVVVRPASEG